ncbi:hypothetical protein SEA_SCOOBYDOOBYDOO_44 [Mycobacterium phage ScoobyDoobyDoo]|nr:hypothetical protein SEA_SCOOBYDOOBYDOO_44 [Mycobacterium phage ScoobyDoobyDoo]
MINLSKTRANVRRVAEEAGFVLAENRQYTDVFYREVKAPNTGFGKIAASMGWHLAERVTVDYNSPGHIAAVRLQTPRDQAALDGRYVSYTAKKTFHEKGKRQAAIDYLVSTKDFYEPLA